MAITPLPTPPSRDDPANFAARGDAFLGALPDFATELNDALPTINEAIPASEVAVALVNYQGEYSSSVTYVVGQSVTYNDVRYMAKKTNLNITPVNGNDWYEITSGVEITVRSILNQSSAITLTAADSGYLLLSGSVAIDLNLPNATTLVGRTFVMKNIGNFPIFVKDAGGNYLFTLSGGVGVAIWASDISTSSGGWATQELPPAFIGTIANIGNTRQAYPIAQKPVSKISDTQQIIGYNRALQFVENPYAAILTLNGSDVTIGTSYLLANENAGSVSVTMCSGTKGIATWTNSLGFRGCVISVSGTTITAGTPITIHSSSSLYGYNLVESLSATTCISVAHVSSSNIKSWVLTISDMTLSAGTGIDLDTSAEGYPPFLGALSSSLAFVAWCNASNTDARCATLSISGTTVTENSNAAIQTSIGPTTIMGCVLSGTKVAVAYNNSADGIFYMRCVNISGTTCTAATAQSVANGTTAYQFDIGAKTDTSGAIIYYAADGSYQYKGWTLSTNTFTFGSAQAAPSTMSSYVGPSITGFSAPSVGTPASSTYMLMHARVNGVNVQTFTTSGTTLTLNTFRYLLPTYSVLNSTYDHAITSLNSNRSISLTGSYVDGGAGTGLSAILVDHSQSTPVVLQALSLSTNFRGEYCTITAISATQALVVFVQSSNNYLVANIITMSGDTISLGTQVTISSTASTSVNMRNLSSTSAIVVWGQTSATRAVVLSVSGTTVTVNTAVTIIASETVQIQTVGLSATKALAMYSSSGMKCHVLTISGTTITVGPQNPININYQTNVNAVGLSSTKCLLTTGGNSAGNYADVVVLNVSGDAVSASLPSRRSNTVGGMRLALTGENKGVAIIPNQVSLVSFTIANDLLTFSNPSTSFGVWLTALQTPTVSAPSSTKIAVYGYDGYTLQSNTVYASGAIN
jgi:hypothetical protein